MRATTDPLVEERRSGLYNHPSSAAGREARKTAPETPESRLRHRNAEEKAALRGKHRGEFHELQRDQDHENVRDHRRGVQFPVEANAARHDRERKELFEKQGHEREALAERHREQHRQRIRAQHG